MGLKFVSTDVSLSIKSQGKKSQKLYYFYTTCPKCVKKLGKNYVVAFAQVSEP